MNSNLAARIQKNTYLRKSYWLMRQIPRTWRRLSASSEDYRHHPPVLLNSFPKSGTHLLLQILDAVPSVTSYGSFLASMPPVPFKERSKQNHLQRIRWIAPSEIIPAHLFYDADYHAELTNKHAILFFIYRDPRDVAISEAHYLTYMTRWHRMHSYFANLKTVEERISAAILGVNEPNFPYDYPDIAQRFQRYQKWLGCPDVFCVKFEELVSEKRPATLHRMAEFLLSKGIYQSDADKLASRLEANIAPHKSRTFRKGKAGQWREVLTEEHKRQIKSVAGDLLIALGYEQNNDW